MAITDKSTDKSLTQLAANAVKESTGTAGQAGVVVVNPDGSNVGGGGSGGAVTIADGANVSQGAVADTAYASGSGTMVSILKGIFTRLRGGQATMANSLPVTISSDQSLLPVSQGIGLEVTGSASVANADVVAATDVSNYRWVALQINGAWSGFIAFQASNDNTNWFSIGLESVASSSSSSNSGASANGLFVGPVQAKFFRARMTSYTSGTATGVTEFYYSTTALHTFGVGSTQSGAWSVQPIPGTSQGLSIYRVLWPANTTGVNIKSSTGQMYDLEAINTAAAVRYIKLYNKATAPTTGTDTPLVTYGLPAGGTINISSAVGKAFGAGIGVAVTTGVWSEPLKANHPQSQLFWIGGRMAAERRSFDVTGTNL